MYVYDRITTQAIEVILYMYVCMVIGICIVVVVYFKALQAANKH